MRSQQQEVASSTRVRLTALAIERGSVTLRAACLTLGESAGDCIGEPWLSTPSKPSKRRVALQSPCDYDGWFRLPLGQLHVGIGDRMAGPRSPSAVEHAQRRLREVLAELRAASEQDLDARAYYRLCLTKLVEATAAEAGACSLLRADGHWEPKQTVGNASAEDDAAAQRRTLEILQEVRRTGKPWIDGGPSHTAIFYPFLAVGELRGVVRLDLAVETEAAQQGCLKFLGEAAESVERFHLLADRRAALHRAAKGDGERRLSAAVHAALNLSETAFALANEGRLWIDCDRLTVLVRHGRRYRIAAISGQDDVNRRTETVRSLEEVVRRCAVTGELLAFPGGEGDLDGELTQELEDYVDESHVKRLVVVPLVPPTAEVVDDGSHVPHREPLAALVVEYFGDTPPQPDELRRIETVARCGTAALRNACEYDTLFLLSLWRTLGRWRQACFEPGTRRRTWLSLCAVAAALTALATVPADFTAYCRGTLQPTERRRVFAPLDGTVKHIAVKHGARVVQGQTLVELRNTDLDIAEAEVAGRRIAAAEQLSAVERTLFDEGKRLTAEERARLSGERSRFREQIAALDRQLELYAEKRKLLVVVSPIDGEVTTWSADDLLENRPVRQGQQLLTVAAVGGPWELELRVPDDRSGRVVEAALASSEPLRVTFSPAVDPGVVRSGTVTEIQNSAELRGEDGNTVLVRAAIRADELPQRRPGAEVAAHLHCGRRAIGYVWLCDVYNFVQSRVLFRWF